MNVSTLSIVIPVYNEEKTIAKMVQLVQAVDLQNIQKEIILVDDGSKDGTRDILKTLENDCKVIYKAQNGGKGTALKEGLIAATGDVVVVQDADLEYDPEEYMQLLEPIIKGHADVVYGSRFIGGRPRRMIYFSHQLANQFITFLSNIFTGYNLTDVETGHKMFTRAFIQDIAPKLQSKRFGFEIEVTARLARTSARLYEVGVAYYGRSRAEGKHITFKDGLLALYEIVKYNVLDRS